MRTGGHLAVERMGDKLQGVRLLGDPAKPEHETFVVLFPGGHVEISRLDDGAYWAHVGCNRKGTIGYDPFKTAGEIVDGRIDTLSDGVQDLTATDHVALRIKPAAGPEQEH